MLSVKIVDNKITLVESDLPYFNDDELLVRMHSCGICGSDLEKVYGNYGMKSLRVGHEPAGHVIKVGKNIKKFQEGDRVFVHVDIVFKATIQCVPIIKIVILNPVACLSNLSFQNGILNTVAY